MVRKIFFDLCFCSLNLLVGVLSDCRNHIGCPMKIKTAGVKPVEILADRQNRYVPYSTPGENKNLTAKINCGVCGKYLGMSKTGKPLKAICAVCGR